MKNGINSNTLVRVFLFIPFSIFLPVTIIETAKQDGGSEIMNVNHKCR